MNLLSDTPALIKHIMGTLNENESLRNPLPPDIARGSFASTVLFLLGPQCEANTLCPEPSLILNKRSMKVKQAGDLCCPGGSLSSRLDSYLAKLLYLPGSPLRRWPYWSLWQTHQPNQAGELAMIFAASLREGFEEMRLNPLGVKLLGLLPSQQLVMFHRIIYPLVCWIPRQQRFRPNWEVEKIVYIPVRNLLDSNNYGRYRLNFERIPGQNRNPGNHDFACFMHRDGDDTENLWGATFRITMAFLEVVFGFKPPDLDSLPVVSGILDKNYLTGGE
jgi:hypothetical protein